MLSMSPWFSKISSRVFSQRFSRFKASIIFGFTSKYLPEILLRENIWVKRGSIPGEVPATIGLENFQGIHRHFALAPAGALEIFVSSTLCRQTSGFINGHVGNKLEN